MASLTSRFPEMRDPIASVTAQGLEGLVAKRRDSRYEPGTRSGAWMKQRINRGQEFVIGGCTVGTKTLDALIFGYYEGARLMYAARTRSGFTPAMRDRLFRKFRGLEKADLVGEARFLVAGDEVAAMVKAVRDLGSERRAWR